MDERNTLVVGLGASAGGLKPLQNFFKSLPDDPGMAFIVVIHLSPSKESNLAEILDRKTSLSVQQVSERTPIKRNHIYVIPPNKLLSVEDDHLELSDPANEHGIASIDLLFRTLGRKKQKYSAGIIFSGTGSDGVTGMKIIKEEGGITIAQDPQEAKHGSMPSNVIETGVVDKVLTVNQMVKELLEYQENLHKVRIAEEAEALLDEAEIEEVLSEIFSRIRSRKDHDFSNYRRSSVLRRIDRRMRLNRVQALTEYVDYIKQNPDELDQLYKDLLISVTNFFRDPEAFKALEEKVIPKLFEDKEHDEEIRIWVPGCATGEEAYTVAILALEYASELDEYPKIQIFASDVDSHALNVARAGRYPISIENDISTERLRRFFQKNGDEYKVKEILRDIVMFAKHDLLKNPPFSRLDMITCRNLLIYLNKDLQTEVFNLFHYALRNNGWLFLGKSDSRLGIDHLFAPVNKKFRIYRQKTSTSSRIPLPDMPLLYNKSPVSNFQNSSQQKKDNIEKLHWSILARLYAPQSVLISEEYEVIHSTNGIDQYLQYSGGEPSSNILNMVKPELRQNLRSLLFQLKNEEPLPIQKKMQVKIDDKEKTLEVVARRFNNKEFPEGMIHIVFRELPKGRENIEDKKRASEKERAEEDSGIIESLEKELEYTREQLQLSVEEYETSNEELRASNEELQSMNEELQSATEELETSQEELQSVNEELKTVNEQLESKLDELSRAHSDLENLMEATEVGIIFVDRNFRVQRFTSSATDIFNLIESDEGRPLEHITHSLENENLMDEIRQVLYDLEKIKKVVKTNDDLWYVMRLRPYRSSDNKIDGVVLSFTEFTELREAKETIESKSLQESLAVLGLYALEQKDLEMILQRAIQQTCTALELKCAMLLKLSEDKKTLKILMEADCDCEKQDIENIDKLDVGYALNSKEPVTVLDYENEDRFGISPLMENKEMKSSVLVAIRGTEDVFGVLAFYCEETREFTKRDLNYLQVVATILGTSIEQIKMNDKLEQTNKRLQHEMKRSEEFQKEILNTSIIKRWELGGYLHDNFGQLLASAKIMVEDIKYKLSNNNLNVADEATQISAILDTCISGIRDIIHNIIPLDVEQEGVAQAFRIVMNRTYKMYKVSCVLKDEDDVLNEIKNREAATHLYHIVQEAVKNASTHGSADSVLITAKKENEHFVLQIKDDGVGLKATQDGKGKGLRIMKHRMDILGGKFHIEQYSEDGRSGTQVICSLPWENIKKKKGE